MVAVMENNCNVRERKFASNSNSHHGLFSSLVPDFQFIQSLNLHAGAFLESLVTFVRAGVGLSHVTISHIN